MPFTPELGTRYTVAHAATSISASGRLCSGNYNPGALQSTIRYGAEEILRKPRARCSLHSGPIAPETLMSHAAIETVNEYIKRFGEAVGVELHPLDADGYTDVRHGSVVIGINAFVKKNVLLILARLGKAPGQHSIELYRRLLELNFLATRSCCFAIDEKTQRIYLRTMRPLDALDYEEFVDLLETVAAVAETMQTAVPELSD